MTQTLSAFFGKDIVTVARATLVDDDPLVADAATASWCPRRRAEFATGRLCARIALARLGETRTTLPINADRSPRWPAGVSGSITHTRGCCIAAVGRADRVGGIGIDAACESDRDEGLGDIVCAPRERRWLLGQRKSERARCALLILSAKEAVYKSLDAREQSALGFQDCEVTPDLDRGAFRIEARSGHRAAPVLARVTGRFLFHAGFIFTFASSPVTAPSRGQ
jgi:4'-phosphopantetheinyl transferase EntD